jgi:hypothetical protein
MDFSDWIGARNGAMWGIAPDERRRQAAKATLRLRSRQEKGTGHLERIVGAPGPACAALLPSAFLLSITLVARAVYTP